MSRRPLARHMIDRSPAQQAPALVHDFGIAQPTPGRDFTLASAERTLACVPVPALPGTHGAARGRHLRAPTPGVSIAHDGELAGTCSGAPSSTAPGCACGTCRARTSRRCCDATRQGRFQAPAGRADACGGRGCAPGTLRAAGPLRRAAGRAHGAVRGLSVEWNTRGGCDDAALRCRAGRCRARAPTQPARGAVFCPRRRAVYSDVIARRRLGCSPAARARDPRQAARYRRHRRARRRRLGDQRAQRDPPAPERRAARDPLRRGRLWVQRSRRRPRRNAARRRAPLPAVRRRGSAPGSAAPRSMRTETSRS